jgi:hypothetical protein
MSFIKLAVCNHQALHSTRTSAHASPFDPLGDGPDVSRSDHVNGAQHKVIWPRIHADALIRRGEVHGDLRGKDDVGRSSVAHPRPFHAYTEQGAD